MFFLMISLTQADEKFEMDSKKPFFKRLPVLFVIAGVAVWGVFFLWPRSFSSTAKHGKFEASHVFSSWSFSELVETYGQAWLRVQAKVDGLRHADEQNLKVRLENAHLKLNLETFQMGCHEQSASNFTKMRELKLTDQTGSRIGRALASVTYKVPPKLLPSQLYTLGIAYLKAHEEEKAAVIFSTLTGLEETSVYKTPQNLLIAGLAWYRVENYILAESYFDEVLKRPEKPEIMQYQAQARLWKALVAKKLTKDLKAQFWLKELVDHHPHSPEAKWIN